MKRIFAVILTLACLFGLVACDIGTSATTTEKPKPTAAELKEKVPFRMCFPRVTAFW